jgi:hypothetical protein
VAHDDWICLYQNITKSHGLMSMFTQVTHVVYIGVNHSSWVKRDTPTATCSHALTAVRGWFGAAHPAEAFQEHITREFPSTLTSQIKIFIVEYYMP